MPNPRGKGRKRPAAPPRAGSAAPAQALVVLVAIALACAAAMAGGRAAGRAAHPASAGAAGDGALAASLAGSGAAGGGADAAALGAAADGIAAAQASAPLAGGGDGEGSSSSSSTDGAGDPSLSAAASGAPSGDGTGASASAAAAALADARAAKKAAARAKKAEQPPAEKPPPEPPASISGRVVDTDGAPVEGARLRLQAGRKIWKEGRTDAEGRFRLDDLRGGRYRLTARAGGYLDAGPGQAVDLAPSERRDGVDIVLKPAGIVTGHVINELDEPVAGSRVSIRRGGAFGNVSTKTGEDGSFVLRGARPGRNTLVVEDDRYLPAKPQNVRVPAIEGDAAGNAGRVDGIVVRLAAGGIVEGATLGVEGAPVPTVVSLQDGRGRRLRNMKADAGSFHFPGLPAGRYQIVAMPANPKAAAAAAADGTGAIGATAELVLGAGERRRADLILDPGGAMAGVVVDGEGRPVANVRVKASALGFTFAGEGKTDAEGRFEVRALIDATYRVQLEPPELFQRPDSIDVDVVDGDGPRDLAFALESGARVEGHIHLPNGSPAGGAAVSVFDLSGRGWGSLEADPAGKYRIGRLPPGDLELFARAEGNVVRLPLRLSAGETRAFDVLLEPAARVSGLVFDPALAPANNAVVDLIEERNVGNRSARSNGRGEFTLADVYPGNYVLRAKRNGQVAEMPLSITPGMQVQGIELRLR